MAERIPELSVSNCKSIEYARDKLRDAKAHDRQKL